MNAKELREKKGSLIHQQMELQKQADLEKRMLHEDEEKQWDAIEAELRKVEKNITIAEKADLEADAVEVKNENTAEKYTRAFEDYVRYGKRSEVLNQGMSEFRTTQSGQNTTTTTGGYLIPTYMGDKVIKMMDTVSPIRQWATVYTTAGAGNINFPTIDDTGNKGRILAEETQATQTLLAFGQKTLGAHLFHSDIVPVSYQLLQDSAFNIEQLIIEMLAARVARGEDYYYILGNGSGQPHGVEHAASVQGAYMAKTAVTRLTILDLIHSVNAYYRQSPKAGFLMADSTVKVIKKLSISSSDDRSMWQPALSSGQYDTIEGFRYFTNENVDAFGTAGNKPMYFGDWSQLYIRDVAGFQMQVFNERYADFLQRGFQLWHRTDCELMNTSAIKHAVCAAT